MKLNIQLFASVSSSKYDGRYLKLTATETATSIENNTSTIHWKFESIGGSSSYYTIFEYGVFYNGNQLYDGTSGLKSKNYSNHSFPVTKGSVEGDITIEHNADGTAPNVSFAMFGSVYKNKTNQYDLSLPLTTIPRASQPRLSSSNVDMGTTITIYTDRVSTTFTHTIRYWFGNANGTIASNVGDSTSWTPPVSLANQIPSAASGYGTIYCDTYSNGTLIGTKTIDFTLNVPSNVVPSVSFTQVQEAGDVPSSWGIYVRTKSRIALAISGSGVYGSAISGYKISYYGGAVLTQSATTSYIQNTGNVTFTGQVTDTRGRSASTTTTINVVDYNNPTISTAQVQRCDANGNIDNNGEYMYISYGASISSCSNKNTPSAVYKVGYRVHNTGDYTYVNLTTNANSYSANGMLFTDGIKAASASGTKVQFSTSNTYDIIFYVRDYFMEYTNLQLLDAGFDLMNFNASGKSMAIGKVSEASANEELFEMGLPFKIVDGIKYVELTNENILQLKPGYYFKEGSTGWGENNWPIATWHATLKVSGTAYDNNNGYRILEVFTTDNRVYKKTQSWNSWSSWEQINNNLVYINHGDDLDNFQDTGYYLGNQTNNISNSPDGNTTIDGLLVVERVGSDLFFAIQTFYYSNGFIYKRMSWFGAYWTSWKKIDN